MQAHVAGVLFGRAEPNLCEIQVFRSIPETEAAPHGDSLDSLTEVVEQVIGSSRTDPELSGLSLLGWYSFRASGGLHESDVAFHNRFFRQPNEVALILRPEQHPNVLFEIYSKAGSTLLSEEEHRWGSLRLSTASTILGPIDVAMRAKVGDEFYLRAYQVSRSLERADRRDQWASAVEATKSTVRSIFRQKRKESYTRDAASYGEGYSRSAQDPEAAALPALARAAAVGAPEARVSAHSNGHPDLAPAVPNSPAFTRRFRDHAIPDRDPAAVQRIVAGDPPALPAVIKPPKRAIPWLSSIIVFAIAAGATFALYVQGYANSGDTPHFLRAIFPDTGLALKVEGQGDRVLLSWNRRNALVRSSTGGILHIDDGPQHRDVRLDPAQIANGSVLYRPGSGDVSFRLEVHGPQGAALAETTRVLDGTKAEPLEVKNLAPDVSIPPPAAAPTSSPAAFENRDQQARREDYAKLPQVARAAHNPAPSPARVTNPAPTAANRSTAPPATSGSSAAPPKSPAPSPLADDSTPAGLFTASNSAPAGGQPPSIAQATRSSLPLSQTTSDKPGLSTPATTDSAHQADTSKVSNWEEIPSASNPPQPAPPRASSNSIPEPSPARSVIDNRPAAATFVPPKPLRQVLPDLKSLGNVSINATSQLEVAVRVNKKGHVTEAYLVGDASKIPPRLARSALNAAKQWTFQPATLRGKSVPSDHTIVFEFRPSNR